MLLKIEELREGMVLKEPIIKETEVALLEKGAVLTQRIIDKLKALEVVFVNVDSLEAEKAVNAEEVKETVNLQTREETAEALKTFLKNPNDENIQNMKENTKEIVKTINDDTRFNYDLESYMNQKDIHAHSVRVTCLSIVLAKIYNNNLKESYPNISQEYLINLEDIAIAALLHDIGVICKDTKKLSEINEIPDLENVEKSFPGIKDTPLDQYDEKFSAVYSYCLVGNTQQLNQVSKYMILLSNEPESEEGCLKVPFKINSGRQPDIIGGKIIRTCDIYDKIMYKTIEQEKSFEEVAAAMLYYTTDNKINSQIEQLLINNLPLYPIGTKVKLSNGKFAVVKESFLGPRDSYLPVVKTFDGNMVDLRKDPNVTVKSIISGEDICKAQMRYQLNVSRKAKMQDPYQLD